jgi:hypothetical protein
LHKSPGFKIKVVAPLVKKRRIRDEEWEVDLLVLSKLKEKNKKFLAIDAKRV